MFKRLTSKISALLPLLLILLSLVLAWKNFTPGTWLSGWDNLHTEFNPILNLRRSFYAVWQEYQGLGVLSGNAHASDLSREIVLFVLSPFVPAFLVRYFWTFLMLVLGPLGVYFFVKTHLFPRGKKAFSNFAAFVAGAFYLLNLATVQTFYTPYEAFIGFYGFFPWLIFFALNYTRKGKTKNLLIFFIVSFFATSAFYVLTPFVVYFIVLAVFLLGETIYLKRAGLIRSLKVLIVVFVANAFWLIPSCYFALTNVGIVGDSKINSFSTPETKLMNEASGRLSDVAALRGFWFDYLDLGQNGKFDYLMAPWRSYFENSSALNGAYILFGLAVLGLVMTIFRKKLAPSRFSAILLFFISYFMLATVNSPFGFLYSFLSKNMPLFDVAFRSPFTKWSTVSALVYASGLGYLVYIVPNYVKRFGYILAPFVATLLVFLMLWVSLPAFQGNLIMKTARVDVPNEYFDLYEFFDKEPTQARIAFFPVHTIWGWNFLDWGYRGSGFLWYGIKQPILDRAFDVWSPLNEAFFNEVSNAFYGDDEEGLSRVFDKYDVTYILIDENVIVPEQDREFMRYGEAEKLFTKIGSKLVFEEGSLKVYKLEREGDGFVYSLGKPTLISAGTDKPRRDGIFSKLGDYIEIEPSNISSGALVFPFANIYQEEVDGVSYEDGEFGKTWINIARELREGGDYELVIPPIQSGTVYQGLGEVFLQGDRLSVMFTSSARVVTNDKEIEGPELADLEMGLGATYKEVIVAINGETVNVSNGSKVVGAFPLWAGESVHVEVFDARAAQTIESKTPFLTQDINTCWEREGEEGVLNVAKSGDVVSLEVKDLVGCNYFKLGQLEGKKALLSISLPFRSGSNARPDFCLVAEGEYDCLNGDVFYTTSTSKEWSEAERKTILETDKTYWLGVQARPPDEAGKKWQIDYKAPKVESFPLITSASFDAGIWRDLVQETRIKGINGHIDLKLFGIKSEVDMAVTGKHTIKNCDIFERGSVDKTIDNGEVVYSSQDGGSICDYSPLFEDTTSGSYLARFIGENLLGRGLKFYLYDKATSHNDLNVLLKTGDFDQTFAILNQLFIEPDTYVLNLESKSFGEYSEARVKNIQIYQIPTDWVSSWYFEPEVKRGNHGYEDLNITSINKMGTYKYTLDIEGDSQNVGVVSLSQGYDKGWVAFQSGGLLSFVSKRLEHVKVNGWANGWLVPTAENDNQPAAMTIVYWPQYLEFLGLALGAISLTILLLKGFRLTKEGGGI